MNDKQYIWKPLTEAQEAVYFALHPQDLGRGMHIFVDVTYLTKKHILDTNVAETLQKFEEEELTYDVVEVDNDISPLDLKECLVYNFETIIVDGYWFSPSLIPEVYLTRVVFDAFLRGGLELRTRFTERYVSATIQRECDQASFINRYVSATIQRVYDACKLRMRNEVYIHHQIFRQVIEAELAINF